jgi:hypothetical protein
MVGALALGGASTIAACSGSSSSAPQTGDASIGDVHAEAQCTDTETPPYDPTCFFCGMVQTLECIGGEWQCPRGNAACPQVTCDDAPPTCTQGHCIDMPPATCFGGTWTCNAGPFECYEDASADGEAGPTTDAAADGA